MHLKTLLNAFYIRHLLGQRRRLYVCLAIFISQAVIGALGPLPLSFAIDHVLAPKPDKPAPAWLKHFLEGMTPVQALVAVAIAAAVVAGSAILLDLLENVYVTIVSNSLSESIKKEMFRKISLTQKAYLDKSSTADMIGRLSQDTLNVQVIFQTGMPVLVRSIPSLIFIIAIMFTVNPWAAGGMILVAGLMFFTTYHFTEAARRKRREVRGEMANYEHFGSQALNGFMMLKLLRQESYAARKMARLGRKVSRPMFTANFYEALMMCSMDSIKNGLRVLLLLAGGYAVLRGHFTVGGIMLFMSYINQIAAAMSDLVKFSYKSARALASLDNILEVVRDAEANVDPEGTERLARQAPVSVTFDRASFGYAERGMTVDNLSVGLYGNQVVALTGPSGVGKSTLLNLLARIIRPASGSVKINGQDVSALVSDDLRAHVTYIPQQTYFLNTSVRENTALSVAHETPSEERLWRALAAVNAEGFVRELPDQLNTLIGDGGRVLSGGQERRLALARAFLRHPSGIFLFDEPTDSLDPYSRQIVLESIRKLAQAGALVFFTTHRQDELAIADKVLEFYGEGSIGIRENDSLKELSLG